MHGAHPSAPNTRTIRGLYPRGVWKKEERRLRRPRPRPRPTCTRTHARIDYTCGKRDVSCARHAHAPMHVSPIRAIRYSQTPPSGCPRNQVRAPQHDTRARTHVSIMRPPIGIRFDSMSRAPPVGVKRVTGPVSRDFLTPLLAASSKFGAIAERNQSWVTRGVTKKQESVVYPRNCNRKKEG